MNREDKYKYLATILFKQLIVLEKDTANLQKKLEKISKDHIINFSLEIKDIIPFKEIIDLLGADDEVLDILTNIIDNCEYQNIEQEIETIFNLYIT